MLTACCVLGTPAAVNTSKTAAAAAAEFLVVRDNLDALIDGVNKEQSRYDGYSSCPLVTKQGECMPCSPWVGVL